MTSNRTVRRTVGVAPSLLAVSAATVLAAFALPVLELPEQWDHASGHVGRGARLALVAGAFVFGY